MNSLRNRLGLGSEKRYHSGEFNALDEISDPRTTEDETRTSWREFVSENQFLVVTVIVGILAGIAVIGNWLLAFIPAVIGNVWVQRATVLLFTLVGGYVVGVKSHSSTMQNIDWLVLVKSNGVQWYPGYYTQPDEDEAPLFIPTRGFTFLETQAHPYTIEQFSRELVRMQSSARRDPKDPVVIRLHPEFVVVTETDFGTVVAQLSEELEMDENGNASNVVAPLPDLADDDAISRMKEKVSELNDELRDERARSQMLRRQRDNAREEARKNRSELLEEWFNQYQKVQSGEMGMSTGMNEFAQPYETEDEFAEEETVDIDEIEEELEDED